IDCTFGCNYGSEDPQDPWKQVIEPPSYPLGYDPGYVGAETPMIVDDPGYFGAETATLPPSDTWLASWQDAQAVKQMSDALPYAGQVPYTVPNMNGVQALDNVMQGYFEGYLLMLQVATFLTPIEEGILAVEAAEMAAEAAGGKG